MIWIINFNSFVAGAKSPAVFIHNIYIYCIYIIWHLRTYLSNVNSWPLHIYLRHKYTPLIYVGHKCQNANNTQCFIVEELLLHLSILSRHGIVCHVKLFWWILSLKWPIKFSLWRLHCFLRPFGTVLANIFVNINHDSVWFSTSCFSDGTKTRW